MNYSIFNNKTAFTMKRFISTSILIVLSMLMVTNCTAQKNEMAFPAERWRFSSENNLMDSEKAEEIFSFIAEEMNTTGLFVVKSGKLIGYFGDIDELSYLASCRKSILAMLYGKYVEDGTIDLTKTMDELGMDDIGGLLDIEKTATIDHLITARSGVYHPASNGGDSSADAPERGSQEPGDYFLYNNWDFNAAGAIFEKLTGKNIYDEIESQLAIPLQFQDWDRQAQRKSGNLTRSKYPAYHIWLSTRDMARIGHLMLNEGNWNGKQLISKEWARKIVSIVTPLEEMNPDRYREAYHGYGYMWWLWDGEKNTGAFEGAYSARGAMGQYITVFPAIDLVIAHKTKAEYGRSTGWGAYEKLFEMIIDVME